LITLPPLKIKIEYRRLEPISRLNKKKIKRGGQDGQ